jgi:ABC-type branched-subunit amino acid transport system substrate-binding protein
LLILLLFITAGCRFPGSTKPVIKVGLVAPFEGELRPFGYQRLYGVKLALQEANLAGGVADYKIELVALNDYGDQGEATLQARELVIDSDVRAVIGQWEPVMNQISAPTYAKAELAVVDPVEFSNISELPEHFATSYQTLSGSPPDRQAEQAYLATRHLLTAIAWAVDEAGMPARSEVLRALHVLDQR